MLAALFSKKLILPPLESNRYCIFSSNSFFINIGVFSSSTLLDHSLKFFKSVSVIVINPNSAESISFIFASSKSPFLFKSTSLSTLVLGTLVLIALTLFKIPLFKYLFICLVFLSAISESNLSNIALISALASAFVNPKSVIDETIFSLASFAVVTLPIILFQATDFTAFPFIIFSIKYPFSISFSLTATEI